MSAVSNSSTSEVYPQGVERLWYDRKAAAAVLSISVRSVDYKIASGELPTRKNGRRVLIHQTALREYARRDHEGRL